MYTIYTKPNCPQCDQAKLLLKMKGLEFETLDVTSDEKLFDFVVSEGFRGMPAIYQEGVKVGGLQELKNMF